MKDHPLVKEWRQQLPLSPDWIVTNTVLESIVLAAEWALTGKVRGIVTAPISKDAMKKAGSQFWDHTTLLGHLCGVTPTMAFDSEKLRVALTTVHCPLSEVPSQLTADRLSRTIRHTYEWLQGFGIRNPRIAVAGLNPHAGEQGLIGTEEIKIIQPVIAELQTFYPTLSGPFPADTVFGRAYQGHYDAVIAQYHDQGLAPLKLIAFDSAVNTTLGLPFVRTSPDHGTAVDIAYQDRANWGSMKAAIALAIRMSHGR